MTKDKSKKMYSLKPNQDYRDESLFPNVDLSPEALLEDTAKHYDDCYWDYLRVWCNRRNLALHYGHWTSDEKYNHHQALLNKNQLLYDLAGIKSSDHVLDAGCGIGGSSIWMAETHQNRVTGITVSAKQTRYAKKHAERHGVADKVNFEVSDFCNTPFEDESFDIIWGLESVCYAVDKADFLREAYRLLRKGGKVVVCDGFFAREEFDQREWDANMAFFNGWAVPNLATQRDFNEKLEQENFKSIAVHEVTAATMPSSDHMYKISKWLRPVQTFREWFGLSSKAQTANFEVGFAQNIMFREALVEYCIFTAEK
ncbi:MAG: methyltransferase domain-containing protein [Methylococcales bacterium]